MTSALEVKMFPCSEFLKKETKTIHKILENKLNFPDNYRDLSSYSKILSIFLVFQRELERNLTYFESALPLGFEIENRKHLDFIRQDIESLASINSPLSNTQYEPLEFQSLSEMVGGLYVSEGSSLGGRIIQKVMIQMHGVDILKSVNYLNPYGDDTDSMWQQFKNIMDHEVQLDRFNAEQVLIGANKSFNFLVSLVDEAGIEL